MIHSSLALPSFDRREEDSYRDTSNSISRLIIFSLSIVWLMLRMQNKIASHYYSLRGSRSSLQATYSIRVCVNTCDAFSFVSHTYTVDSKGHHTCRCVHTCMHTHAHACTRRHTLIHPRTCMHSHARTRAYTHVRARISTHAHACTRSTRRHAHVRACISTHARACTRIRMTFIRTHTYKVYYKCSCNFIKRLYMVRK